MIEVYLIADEWKFTGQNGQRKKFTCLATDGNEYLMKMESRFYDENELSEIAGNFGTAVSFQQAYKKAMELQPTIVDEEGNEVDYRISTLAQLAQRIQQDIENEVEKTIEEGFQLKNGYQILLEEKQQRYLSSIRDGLNEGMYTQDNIQFWCGNQLPQTFTREEMKEIISLALLHIQACEGEGKMASLEVEQLFLNENENGLVNYTYEITGSV